MGEARDTVSTETIGADDIRVEHGDATTVPAQYAHALAKEISRREAAADRTERLVKITAAVADAVTAAEVFEAVVDHVAEVVEASSAALWLVGDDGLTVELAHCVGYREGAKEKFGGLALDATPSIPALDSIRRGEPLWIPSQEALLREYPHLLASVTKGRSYRVSCLPLVSNGRTLGALGITIDEARETRDDERDFLLLVARYAGQAIERLRLLEGERRSRSRAEQLSYFAKAVVSAERVEEVFDAALDAIAGALGTERSAILLYDDAKVMRFRASRRLSEEYRSAVEGHSPWSPNAVNPEPVLVVDVQSDAALGAYLPLLEREGIASLAFIPLVTRGRLIGKFMVYYGERHDYTPNEVELATAIANHLASVTARFAAIAKLEETIRYNELFAGVLAHDLRTPLGAIMTAAQLVLRRQEGEGEGDRNAKPLGRILTSGERMTRMIEELLDLTRVRAGGGIEIERADADLGDLCSQAVSELELAYPNWRIEREVLGDQSGSWDTDRLLQIISNLVCNAGQHGPADGTILVRLDGRAADAVTFQVHNHGAIPESVLPSLFDPFRGTRHRREHARGLGLGLFIVREIVRAHGGLVDVVSNETQGTTFTVRLPRRSSRMS